jgi:hypothetical protein
MLLAVLFAVAACSDEPGTDAVAPAGSPSAAAAADDPPGSLACGKAVTALRDGTLMTAGVVQDITDAAGTADAPVAAAAQRLSVAFASAIKAEGDEEEPDAIAAVSAAGAEMVRICGDSGLETTG